MHSLQNGRIVIIQLADKDSAVDIWDRQDYLKEPEQWLRDSSIYKEVKVTEKSLTYLIDTSNKIFANVEKNELFRRGRKTISNLILKKLPMLKSFTYYLIIKSKYQQSSRTPSNFKLWNAYRNNSGILRPPFTTTHETRLIIYKGSWRFSKKIEGNRGNSWRGNPCYSRCSWVLSMYSTWWRLESSLKQYNKF